MGAGGVSWPGRSGGGQVRILAEERTKEWLWFGSAWLTLPWARFRSRTSSSGSLRRRTKRPPVRGTLLGGVVYFTFAFVPVFIVYAGLLSRRRSRATCLRRTRARCRSCCGADPRAHADVDAGVVFGALLSAILSTASGALIAPTALCTENIIKQFYPRMSDRQFLFALRTVLVSFSLAALVFALNSKSTMYDMVQNAIK